jgi:type IV pilus assembly protein PilM
VAITIGLDIGSDAVRAAAVEAGKATPVLRRFGEIPLPAGAVEAGDVVDPGAVTEAVAALWKRHGFPRKRVVIGIANQKVIVRQLDVPHLEEGEMGEALPFLALDAIPIPVEDAVLDYVPLEEFSSREGEPMLSILAVAAHRDMIEGLVEIASDVGIGVMSIDLQAFALVRGAFGPGLMRGGFGSQGLVDIGGSLTQIAIVKEGITRFVRIIPTGGHHFTESLVRGLSMDAAEAEERKREVGTLPAGNFEGDDANAQAGRLLSTTADALIDEIKGSINYYLTQSGESALERLVVAGNGARLPHLANRMSRGLGTPVEPARALDHVTVGRIQMTEGELLGYQPVLPAAIGLALWGQYALPPVVRYADVPEGAA